MIRAATAGDVPALVDLEAACFGPDAWSAGLLADEIGGTHRMVLVEESDDVLVGYGSITVLGDVADLNRIAVAPSHRRLGLAVRLLEDLLGRASAGGAARMLLEVAEGNEPARALYDGAGFATISRRRGYYADGTDALVLQRDLP